MKRPANVTLKLVSIVCLYALILSNLQDEDAEANSNCACASTNGYKVHDQNSSPESSLNAVHGQECPRLERIAKE